MKKLMLIVCVMLFISAASYANPYTNALQKARNVRTQIETVSNPDNYLDEGE
jgi:hypothetical protein